MSYIMKNKEEMLENLEMINMYIEGALKVIPIKFYEKFKPSNGSAFLTPYRNPNRSGYNLLYSKTNKVNDIKIVAEKKSTYLMIRIIANLEHRVANGIDIEKYDLIGEIN